MGISRPVRVESPLGFPYQLWRLYMFLSKEELQSKTFSIGDWVYSRLYGGRFGVVINIHGIQNGKPAKTLMGGAIVTGGSSASFDIVFENGGMSMKVPESIVRGVQWDLPDRDPVTQEIIDRMIEHHHLTVAKKEAEDAAKKAAFNAEIERLRVDPDYKGFEQIVDRSDSTKIANKNIRILLKKQFKGVKFSVRKESYDSTWVTWPQSSGLARKAVQDVVSIFRTGFYDIEEDIHRDEDAPFNVVFGGIRYLTVQPSI